MPSIDNDALNTHRIAAIDEVNGMRSFTTKGDNNDVADTHIISDGDIVRNYLFALPQMGKVMDFLSSSMGFLIVIVLPMLLFFIYQVYHLIVVGMNLKRDLARRTAWPPRLPSWTPRARAIPPSRPITPPSRPPRQGQARGSPHIERPRPRRR